MDRMKMMKGPNEQRDLMIKQLIEGIEAAKQLQKRILIRPTKSDHNHDDHDNNPQLEDDDDEDQAVTHSLLDKMMASFDKTISIAKQIKPSDNSQSEGSTPHSLALSSPKSENSHHHLHLPKKRKMMPRWSQRVAVDNGGKTTGLEGALDDGFSWRKYGQKEILGTQHPRGYYRCTHRQTQGCGATKQVQRSDEDASIFHVIYHGEHTCSRVAHFSEAQSKFSKQVQVKTEPKPQPSPNPQPQMAQSSDQEVYLALGPDGALKVEPTDDKTTAQIFRSFSFNPAQFESGPTDNFLLDYSATFGSPTTSESDHFPVAGLHIRTSESDLNGSISGPNSVSNSPMACDFEFPIDQLQDVFPDIAGYFS